ncbi:MAG: YjbQ family protein, partial [Nitrospirota bacterium]|nr:YjbQ family protein [Nitrospirota bacterium]
MRETILLKSTRREELIDITGAIREILERGSLQNGLVHIYAQGATAAVMVQENWDESVPLDVVNLLRKLI